MAAGLPLSQALRAVTYELFGPPRSDHRNFVRSIWIFLSAPAAPRSAAKPAIRVWVAMFPGIVVGDWDVSRHQGASAFAAVNPLSSKPVNEAGGNKKGPEQVTFRQGQRLYFAVAASLPCGSTRRRSNCRAATARALALYPRPTGRVRWYRAVTPRSRARMAG